MQFLVKIVLKTGFFHISKKSVYLVNATVVNVIWEYPSILFIYFGQAIEI